MPNIQFLTPRPERPAFPKTQFKDYPDVLNVLQAAELLSVCKNTIYKLIRDGELPCRRIGTAIRIRKKDVLKFLVGDEKAS